MQSITVKCKEIRVRNANIVVEGENRAELVEFTVMDAGSIEGLEGMAFYVQYRNGLGETGMDPLERNMVGDALVLDWLPSASFTKERGAVEIQIVGFTQTLEPTEDTKYQSGKLYFTSAGVFIPVYPSTSTHSPKVGDDITGTVYENAETSDDHRWSTMKALLFLPEDVFEGGTPVYTEDQVNALITQIQGEIDLARGYAEAAASSASDASDSEDAAEGSASDAYDSALISEGYAVGTQMGVDVGSGSIYYENNAKHYSEEASDSATAASASAGAASTSATIADNARIQSVTETESQDDGGTNVITFTYKDGTTKTFTVKNGKAGTPFEIYKTYASIAAMNADFDNVEEGKFVIISTTDPDDPDNAKLYVRGSSAFTFVTDMSGAQGIQGPEGKAATITVGTVSTGAAGSSATVVNSGTSSAAVFDFSIPKGDTGATGAAATIAVGTVTAGDDPSDASVTNSGTSSAAVFDFVLPKGDTGNTPLLSIGEVTYGDTPDVTIDTTDPDNPVLDFVLKTSEVGVVDNLDSSSSVDALSARMGKDLQSQINQHEARLSNLEQISGEYVTEDMQDYSAVPTGKATYALVETMKGVSRVENQLMNKSSLRPTTSDNGITCTNNGDGTFTVSGTATGASYTYFYSDGITLNPSHTYFVVGNTYTRVTAIVNGSTSYFFPASSLISGASRLTQIFNNITSGTTVNFTLPVVLVDLTLYFNNGTIPTLAEIQSKYPELLEPRAYNAGEIVDSTYTSVTSVGKNLCDTSAFENVNISTSGNVDPNLVCGSSTDYIAVVGGSQMTFSTKTAINGVRIAEYDADKNFLNRSDTPQITAITLRADTRYVRWCINYNGSTTVTKAILDSVEPQLEYGSSRTTFSPYHAPATLTIPSVTLKGAGSVHDELDVESGDITRRIGSYTFTGNETPTASYQRTNGDWYCIFQSIFNGGKNGGEGLSDKGVPFTTGNVAFNGTGSYFVIRGEGGLAFYLAGATSASDVTAWISANLPKVYYELATPTTESVTPVLNNTLKTEGGGSVFTDADVDGQFTLGFLNL